MTDPNEPDDATLLRHFCTTRDEAAFTRLVRRHLPLVYHVARRRLGSRALAEEAAQNTFAVLAAKAKHVARHPERLRAWLHRTAHLEACALDEILETIQAGRFAPLVEFLPRATPAGLRAIIAEDDIYEYGEIDGKEAFGTARYLALLRWAEIDPHGAFSYAKMRDLEMGGFWLGETATVIGRWSRAEPVAALDALVSLPSADRVKLLTMIFRDDPEAAANAMLCAVNQAAYLLKRQLESQARTFTEKGGFTESLHATRTKARTAQGTSPDGPPCPLCGQPTRRRSAANGPRAGKEFFGCTAYPDCRGIIDIPSDGSDQSDQS